MTVNLDNNSTETINVLFPVVNFLKCVVTEMDLLVVAFKTLGISLGVATHLRCCGIFSDSINSNFLLILTVK